MNTRIHSVKVYRVIFPSGLTFWTLLKGVARSGMVLEETHLWDLLYKAKDGDKTSSGKSLVKKSDLLYLLEELAATSTSQQIFEDNSVE
jgi:hypothetical protein